HRCAGDVLFLDEGGEHRRDLRKRGGDFLGAIGVGELGGRDGGGEEGGGEEYSKHARSVKPCERPFTTETQRTLRDLCDLCVSVVICPDIQCAPSSSGDMTSPAMSVRGDLATEKVARALYALLDLSKALSSEFDVDKLLEVIVEKASDVVDAESTDIVLSGGDTPSLTNSGKILRAPVLDSHGNLLGVIE